MENITRERSEVLKVLSYYQVFRHPLKFEEIHSLVHLNISGQELQYILEQLMYESKVFLHKEYYCMTDDWTMVKKRIEGEQECIKLIPKAKRIGRLISRFPFVKFVGISGSLSKGYADKRTDFDYFIITSKDRLWISRSILHLFKKFTYLFNMQKCFCMNYFIDDSDLEIEDKNIFVMYEIASLIPVYNSEYYTKFKNCNYWVRLTMPQFEYKNEEIYDGKSVIKTLIETCLSILPLKLLNKWLMSLTDYKWKRKWKKANYPMEDYDLAFRTRINISKNHPKNHQKLLLTKLSDFL